MNKVYQSFFNSGGSYKDSGVVIFGAPFDSTTSYRPGARFAPAAMRAESYGLENYSPYLEKDLSDIAYFDSGDLDMVFGDIKASLSLIEKRTAKIIRDGKLPLMLGGEHLVTLGAVRAAKKRYEDLVIVHFDAHIDFRGDYIGNKLSHATVMRRCFELGCPIYQFGIRSGDKAEFNAAKDLISTHKFDLYGTECLAEIIGGRPVYFSIDLDILDPSVFPGTGTPEAGGVTFVELLKAINNVCKLNIKGADLCELAPNWDQSGVSTAVALKILREMLLLICK